MSAGRGTPRVGRADTRVRRCYLRAMRGRALVDERSDAYRLGPGASFTFDDAGACRLRRARREMLVPVRALGVLSLLSRGLTIEQAVDLTGVDPPELRAWVAHLLERGFLVPRRAPAPRPPRVGRPQPIRGARMPQPIPVEMRPSWATLRRRYLQPARPVVVGGVVDEWPALHLWTPNYLDHVFDLDAVDHRPCADRRDYVWHGTTDDRGGILHRHFQPPFPEVGAVDARIWYGVRGSQTDSLHFDEHPNFVACVRGHKQWVLFPPSAEPHLHSPNPAWHPSGQASPVDVFRPDLKRYPRYACAQPHTHVLTAGQVLYIPPRWWHCARCLDPCVTLAMFWGRPRRSRARSAAAR